MAEVDLTRCMTLSTPEIQGRCIDSFKDCARQDSEGVVELKTTTCKGERLPVGGLTSCLIMAYYFSKDCPPLPPPLPTPAGGAPSPAAEATPRPPAPEVWDPKFATCLNAGPFGSPGFDACKKGALECLDPKRGDEYYNQVCLNMSARMAGAKEVLPPSELERLGINEVSHSGTSAAMVDGKKVFAVTLDYAGFRPPPIGEASRKIDIGIPYDGGVRIVKIKIDCRVLQMGGGQRRMTYTISKENNGNSIPLGPQNTVVFSPAELSNLIFVIKLISDGNFNPSSISSIEIQKI